MVLMKQRRRWNNGGLFGYFKLIENMFHMLSCRRNDHPVWRQILLIFFFVYLITLQLLQFVAVGAVMVTIIIFVNQLQALVLEQGADSEIYQDQIITKTFFATYCFMIFLVTFASVAMPLDRAICYFRITSVILGILMISSSLLWPREQPPQTIPHQHQHLRLVLQNSPYEGS